MPIMDYYEEEYGAIEKKPKKKVYVKFGDEWAETEKRGRRYELQPLKDKDVIDKLEKGIPPEGTSDALDRALRLPIRKEVIKKIDEKAKKMLSDIEIGLRRDVGQPIINRIKFSGLSAEHIVPVIEKVYKVTGINETIYLAIQELGVGNVEDFAKMRERAREAEDVYVMPSISLDEALQRNMSTIVARIMRSGAVSTREAKRALEKEWTRTMTVNDAMIELATMMNIAKNKEDLERWLRA